MAYEKSDDEESSSPISFMIGDVEFQNKDGYVADAEGNLILRYGKDPIPIQVKDKPIVNAIHRIRVDGKKFYSIPAKPVEERFAKVVEAMTDLHRKDGKYATVTKNKPFEKSRDNPDSFKRAGEQAGLLSFGQQKNYEKFLFMGAEANLYDPKIRKATPSKAKPRSIRGKKAVEKQTAFEKNPLVQEWQRQRGSHRGSANADKLHQVLAYLDLSPEQIIEPTDDEGNKIPQREIKGWITRRFEEETFTDEKGKKWFFGKRDFTSDPPKKTGIVYDMNPPKYNKNRTITFGKRNSRYKAGSEGVRMPMIALLKGFLEANGVTIGKNPKESMWALIQPKKGKYAQIQMQATDIKAMMVCLEDGMNEVRKLAKQEKMLEEEILYGDNAGKKRKVRTNLSDWEDAYMYFILGLSLGYRSAEAFTLQARILDTKDDPHSGVFIDDKEHEFIVRIYTRKTAKVGMRFYGGNILYGDTGIKAQELIKNRLDQVSKGINIKQRWYNPETKKEEKYLQHSLIGYDGKYAELGTLEYPAQAKLSRDERLALEAEGKPIEQLKLKVAARDRLMVVMRHCYEKVGLTKSYWTTNSLHAIRHTFAQLWIKKSGYNYEFVRDWGHWTILATLMSHYAGQSDTERLQNANKFNATSLDDLIVREDEDKRLTAEQRKMAEKSYGMNYGKGSKEDTKDDNKEMKDAGKNDPELKDKDELSDTDEELVETEADVETEEET